MADFTFPLTPTATPTSPEATATQAPTFGPKGSALGRNLLIPFQRGSNDFVNGEGIELVRSMVAQILGTMSASPHAEGELPWRSDFGSLFHLLRHRNNTPATRELARLYVVTPLARWLPMVRVRRVEVTRERARGEGGIETPVLVVNVLWDIVASSGAVVSAGNASSVRI